MFFRRIRSSEPSVLLSEHTKIVWQAAVCQAILHNPTKNSGYPLCRYNGCRLCIFFTVKMTEFNKHFSAL